MEEVIPDELHGGGEEEKTRNTVAEETRLSLAAQGQLQMTVAFIVQGRGAS